MKVLRQSGLNAFVACVFTTVCQAASAQPAQPFTPPPDLRPLTQITQSPFIVEKQRLGAHVDPLSEAFAGFRCSPSELFTGATWCQRLIQLGNTPAAGTSLSSILYSSDGTIQYANRFVNAAKFAPGDIDGEVSRLSKVYKEEPVILRLPHQDGSPDAVIAVWGKIKFQPLDKTGIQALLTGKPLSDGLLFDYLGDFRQSARLGLPVYRIVGGPGYVWAASYDGDGRGNLRLCAADMSNVSLKTANPRPSSGSSSSSIVSPATAAASLTDAERQAAAARVALAEATAAIAREKMNLAFATALERLTASGQEILKRDQESWFNYHIDLCSKPAGVESLLVSTPDECLAKELSLRTKLLNSEGRHLGQYTIMSVVVSYHLFRYKPDGANPLDTGTNIDEAMWPRIDSPDTPATAQWNAWIEDLRKPKEPTPSVENGGNSISQSTSGYSPERDVTLPRDNLISVVINLSWYGGGAHGSEAVETYTYLLDQGRELRSSDIFDVKQPWLSALRERSAALLRLQLGDTMNQILDKELEGLISGVREWTLGTQGLSIRFSEYSVGPYSDGIPEIVIPWAELTNLDRNSIMPIRD